MSGFKHLLLFALLQILALSLDSSKAKSSSNKPFEDFIEDVTEDKSDRLPRTKVIKTKYGYVQGRVVKIDAKSSDEDLKLPDVQVFMGIRYATPPVGNNR